MTDWKDRAPTPEECKAHEANGGLWGVRWEPEPRQPSLATGYVEDGEAWMQEAPGGRFRARHGGTAYRPYDRDLSPAPWPLDEAAPKLCKEAGCERVMLTPDHMGTQHTEGCAFASLAEVSTKNLDPKAAKALHENLSELCVAEPATQQPWERGIAALRRHTADPGLQTVISEVKEGVYARLRKPPHHRVFTAAIATIDGIKSASAPTATEAIDALEAQFKEEH